MDLDPGRGDSSHRIMLALFVFIAMFFLWTSFYSPRPERPPATEKPSKERAAKPATAHGPTTQAAAEKGPPAEIRPAPSPKPGTAAPAKEAVKPPAPPPPKPKVEPPPRTITVRSKLFTAAFTNQDGALTRLTLLDYFYTPSTQRDARKALRANPAADVTDFGFPVLGQDGTDVSFVLLPRLETEGGQGQTAANTVPDLFTPHRYVVDAAPSAGERRAVFRATFAEGRLEVTKTYLLPSPEDPLQRHLVVELQFKNLSPDPLRLPGYRLRGPGGIAIEIPPDHWIKGIDKPDLALQKSAMDSLGAVTCTLSPKGVRNADRKGCAAVQGLAAEAAKAVAEAEDLAAQLQKADQAVKEASGPEKEAAEKELTLLTEKHKEALRKAERKTADYGGLMVTGGAILWVGIQSNYFAAILEPLVADKEKGFEGSAGPQAIGAANLDAEIQTVGRTLMPGEAVADRYRLYVGPKSYQALRAYETGFERMLPEDRWLEPLSDACAWILRSLYRLIPNYGVAILILTVLVRTLMHPLSKKSQTSMGRMQKLQPQVKEMQEKYKGDRKRQQEEMMKLYKEYGVNPMGGCFPILLQLPVFIGLWRALSESIELRQAPFVLWMRDLSQPDCFLGVVNILPIVSCVIMFLQQRSMPKAGDPQQQQTQKIMGYMMPILLLWLFYSLASGLSLYFIASSLIGIAEQKVIKRHLDQLGELKPIQRKTGDKKTERERKRLLSYTQKRKPF